MKKLILAFCAVLSFSAFAADPITLVVPVSVGGGTDVLARALADGMTRQGTPVVVVNRPGAERSIGANSVATAPSDGKTLFFGAISDTIMLPLYNYPGLQFDETSFVPVAGVGTLPIALVASNNVPANNFKELLEVIKKDPKKYPIAVAGKVNELNANILWNLVGEKPTPVLYKGDVQMATDIVGDHVPLAMTSLNAVTELHKAGKLKIIAILSDRSKEVPEVGTIGEVYKGWTSQYWFAIFAPPGTPKPVTAKIHTAVNKALADPNVKRVLSEQQYKEMVMTQPQFATFFKNQVEYYQKQVKAQNVQ